MKATIKNSTQTESAGGWRLERAGDSDIVELMSWFPDAHSVDIWGGPEFRFPFTQDSFREDCRLDVMKSYTLRDPCNRMAAFGQLYNRNDRGHLARLVSNPGMRRQGAGKRLIELLMRAAEDEFGFREYSLFVYRDNEPAYRCYLEMGFTVQNYPDDAKLQDKCFFLIRTSDELQQGECNDE